VPDKALRYEEAVPAIVLEAAMATPMPTSDMTVADVLEQWPETVSVFQEFKLACVGCVMAPFDTMIDIADIYKMDLQEIMTALNQAIISTRSNE
jgi:hybrid cluster-associated redox disulfide protein